MWHQRTLHDIPPVKILLRHFGSLYCYFLFFCSIYLHLTLCFRKCTQVSIPDIPGTWRADLMPVLQDEKQKNFVEPIKGMTFCLALSCSVQNWSFCSSLPLPSSFYLKGKKKNLLSYKMCFLFIFLYFAHCWNGFCRGSEKTYVNGNLQRPLSWCQGRWLGWLD